MRKYPVYLLFLAVLIAAIFPTLVSAQREFEEVLPNEGPISPVAAPSEVPNLVRAGAWPYGSAEAIAADESRELIFLGSGGAVLVFDVANPLSLTLISDQIHTLGFIEDLFYDPLDQYLYIAAGEGGMEIWDLSLPAEPQQLSVTEIFYGGVEIPLEGITVAGDMAYLAADWGFLHWVDVSDPANPVQVGFNGQALQPRDVFAEGGYLYAVGNGNGPFFNADFARYMIRPDGSLNFSGGRAFGTCNSAFVSGAYAYVGCGSFYIVDLSDPLLPTMGSLPIATSGTVLSGTQAFLAGGSSGLQSVDVGNPALPTISDIYDSPGSANDLVRIGHYVYLADGSAGMRVIDVSDPTSIAEVSFHDTPGYARYAAIQGNYAYLAEYTEGLTVIDVSDPLSATQVGQYQSPGSGYDVAVQGDYAYVANADGGLRIIEVSDPANPAETGFDDTLNAFRVAVNGDYAYVVDAIVNQPYWLRVIDVSNPATPNEVGALQTNDIAWGVVAQGNYIYVANDSAGLRIVDVSDPTMPVEVGSYAVPDVWDVAVQGDYAYLASADWEGGFLIIDISDPAGPILVGEYNPTGWFHPYHVAVLGGYAYVSRQNELHLFDITDPTNPIDLEDVPLPMDISGLSTAGPLVYAADGSAGLQIYRNLLPNSAVTLGPDTFLETLPGTTVTHTFTLHNLGASEQFSLTVGGESWPTTLLNPAQVTLSAGTAVSVSVAVDVPPMTPVAANRSDLFSLTATPAANPTQNVVATGVTQAVIDADLTITLTPMAQITTTGGIVSYTFTLTNSGNYSDSFTLSAGGDWPVTLPLTSTGLLAIGDTFRGLIWVEVPQDATNGQQVVTTLTAPQIGIRQSRLSLR